MIEWTDELRALVFSTRAAPNAAYLAKHLGHANATVTLTNVKLAHAKHRDWGHWAHENQIARVRSGLPKTAPALRPVVERALEDREQRMPPSGSLDLDVEAALVALDLGDTWSGIPFWAAKEGIAFALRAFVRVHQLSPSNHRHGSGGAFWLEESWESVHRVDGSTAWHILRGLVTAAPEAEYAALRSLAEKLRAAVPLGLRPSLGFVFPDERAWVREDAAGVLADPKSWHGDTRWLVTNADVDQAEPLARTEEGRTYGTEHLVSILARCGDEGARVLDALIRGAGRNDLRKDFAKLLALVATPEAASLLGTWLTNKAIAPIATKYFKKHPELTKVALEPVAKGKTKQAGAAALVLEGSGAVAGANASPAIPDSSKLPPILVTPPWIDPVPALVVADVTALAFDPALDFPPAVLEKYEREIAEWEKQRTSEKDTESDEALARWVGNRHQMYLFWIARIRDPKMALALWDEKAPGYWTRPERALPEILARHGVAAIPSLLRYAKVRGADAISGLQLVVAPAIAPLLADIRIRTKSVRPEADAWLRAHPEVAAIGLIPDAVGVPGGARTSAEHALHFLRAAGHGAVVDVVAERYGANVLAAVTAIDPRNAFPAKLPKLPPFANPRALPPVELRTGGALPESALTHLVTMLAFHDPASPYVGLEEVRAFCTAVSLREFAWALFERWLAAAAPPKEQWALTVLGEFGDDEIVRRLVPKLRAWPKEKAIARAQLGLSVLGRIGSELALVHVDAIAHHFPFASLKEKAASVIAEIGARRGLTPDELADRLAPTFGLDPDGSRALDFGGRLFRVGFDEQLRPTVRDAANVLLRDLPKPTKSDDKTKASEATAVWKALKADAKAISAQQIARLERAMVEERTWSSAEIERFFFRHPLVSHLARRLVFRAVLADKTTMLFRVAEDGTLADANDIALKLPEGARIHVIHRLRLSEPELAAWNQVFADYEILQPFEQLARAVHPLDVDVAKLLTSLPSRDAGGLRALRDRGFVDDGESRFQYLVRKMKTDDGAPALAIVSLRPGYVLGRDVPPQKLSDLTLRVNVEDRPLTELGAMAYSELLRDLS
ncbi:hypothetical protein BH09MYX1_BH09MYX1_41200 [soil metagenome]